MTAAAVDGDLEESHEDAADIAWAQGDSECSYEQYHLDSSLLTGEERADSASVHTYEELLENELLRVADANEAFISDQYRGGAAHDAHVASAGGGQLQHSGEGAVLRGFWALMSQSAATRHFEEEVMIGEPAVDTACTAMIFSKAYRRYLHGAQASQLKVRGFSGSSLASADAVGNLHGWVVSSHGERPPGFDGSYTISDVHCMEGNDLNSSLFSLNGPIHNEGMKLVLSDPTDTASALVGFANKTWAPIRFSVKSQHWFMRVVVGLNAATVREVGLLYEQYYNEHGTTYQQPTDERDADRLALYFAVHADAVPRNLPGQPGQQQRGCAPTASASMMQAAGSGPRATSPAGSDSSNGTVVGAADHDANQRIIDRYMSGSADGHADPDWPPLTGGGQHDGGLGYAAEVAVDGHTQHESVAAARRMTTEAMLECLRRFDVERAGAYVPDGFQAWRDHLFYIDIAGDRSRYIDVPSFHGAGATRVFLFDMIDELWGALADWVYDHRHDIPSLMLCSEPDAHVLDRLTPDETARMANSGIAGVARSVLTVLRTDGVHSLGIYGAIDGWHSMISSPAVLPTRATLLDVRLSAHAAGRMHFEDVMGVAWPHLFGGSATWGPGDTATRDGAVWSLRLQDIWVAGPALNIHMWDLSHSDREVHCPVVEHVVNLNFGGGVPVRRLLRQLASIEASPMGDLMHTRLVEVREALLYYVTNTPMKAHVITLLSAPGTAVGAYLRERSPGTAQLRFATNGDQRADTRVPPAALMTEQLDALLSVYPEFPTGSHWQNIPVVAKTPWTLVVHAVSLFLVDGIDREVFAGVLRKVQSEGWLSPCIIAVHSNPQDNLAVISARRGAGDAHVTADTLHASAAALLLVCDVLQTDGSRCGCRVHNVCGRVGAEHYAELHAHIDSCVAAARTRDLHAPGGAQASMATSYNVNACLSRGAESACAQNTTTSTSTMVESIGLMLADPSPLAAMSCEYGGEAYWRRGEEFFVYTGGTATHVHNLKDSGTGDSAHAAKAVCVYSEHDGEYWDVPTNAWHDRAALAAREAAGLPFVGVGYDSSDASESGDSYDSYYVPSEYTVNSHDSDDTEAQYGRVTAWEAAEEAENAAHQAYWDQLEEHAGQDAAGSAPFANDVASASRGAGVPERDPWSAALADLRTARETRISYLDALTVEGARAESSYYEANGATEAQPSGASLVENWFESLQRHEFGFANAVCDDSADDVGVYEQMCMLTTDEMQDRGFIPYAGPCWGCGTRTRLPRHCELGSDALAAAAAPGPEPTLEDGPGPEAEPEPELEPEPEPENVRVPGLRGGASGSGHYDRCELCLPGDGGEDPLARQYELWDVDARAVKPGVKGWQRKTIAQMHADKAHQPFDANCRTCVGSMGVFKRTVGTIDPFIDERPCYCYHVDTVTFDTRSRQGCKYLLVMRCGSGHFAGIPYESRDLLVGKVGEWIARHRKDPMYNKHDYAFCTKMKLDCAREQGPWSSHWQKMCWSFDPALICEHTDPQSPGRANGIAENTVRMAEVQIRAMLRARALPPDMWQDCFYQMEHIRNWMPRRKDVRSSSGDSSTPLERATCGQVDRRTQNYYIKCFEQVGTLAAVKAEGLGSHLATDRWRLGIVIGCCPTAPDIICFVDPEGSYNVVFMSKHYVILGAPMGVSAEEFLGLPARVPTRLGAPRAGDWAENRTTTVVQIDSIDSWRKAEGLPDATPTTPEQRLVRARGVARPGVMIVGPDGQHYMPSCTPGADGIRPWVKCGNLLERLGDAGALVPNVMQPEGAPTGALLGPDQGTSSAPAPVPSEQQLREMDVLDEPKKVIGMKFYKRFGVDGLYKGIVVKWKPRLELWEVHYNQHAPDARKPDNTREEFDASDIVKYVLDACDQPKPASGGTAAAPPAAALSDPYLALPVGTQPLWDKAMLKGKGDSAPVTITEAGWTFKEVCADAHVPVEHAGAYLEWLGSDSFGKSANAVVERSDVFGVRFAHPLGRRTGGWARKHDLLATGTGFPQPLGPRYDGVLERHLRRANAAASASLMDELALEGKELARQWGHGRRNGVHAPADARVETAHYTEADADDDDAMERYLEFVVTHMRVSKQQGVESKYATAFAGSDEYDWDAEACAAGGAAERGPSKLRLPKVKTEWPDWDLSSVTVDGRITAPKNIAEARLRPDWARWEDAIRVENESLDSLCVFKHHVTQRAAREDWGVTTTPIPLRMIFKVNYETDGKTIAKYKARRILVGHKHYAKPGVHFGAVWAPTPEFTISRLVGGHRRAAQVAPHRV